MTDLLKVKKHLVFYRTYHFNRTNVAIHLVCIPLILLSITAALTTIDIASEHPYINYGTLLATTYSIFYILLDWQLGFLAFIFLEVMTWLFKSIYLGAEDSIFITKSQFIKISIGIHVLSWLAQFYGHAFYEKRAPALTDNLLQALVLAPFFVVYEIVFALGFKLDVQKEMNDEAGKIVRKLKLKEKEAKST